MFLRVVRANVSEGVKREYVRVVEAYRDRDGKTRHRTVINLGRRDLLATHLDLGKLGRLLHGDVADAGHIAREDVGAIGAWDWGPMLAARAMWSELGLDTILDNLARPDRRAAVRLADRALVLIANRLTAPRVRVAPRQLQQWYRTLDQLVVCKVQVEHALFLRLRDLFSLQVDMVFYDLTSTYFEGRGPPRRAPMAIAGTTSRATRRCWSA